MSHVIFCDGCGIELAKGRGVYHVQISSPDESRFNSGANYDLCVKCAKPFTEWKRVNPKRKMVPVLESG